MQGKKIKWGNILIFLLIIVGWYLPAFYYKNPKNFRRFTGIWKKTEPNNAVKVQARNYYA